MFEKYLIPLLIASNLGMISGKTRLQKLVRLIEVELKSKGVIHLDYRYQLYHHGPFSFELANIAESLVYNGFLYERQETTPDGNTLYVYKISSNGRKLLREALQKDIIVDRLARVVSDMSKKYGALSLPDLVMRAYETM
ncbi:MAG: hypothetical protein ACW99U_18735 [Candidatus Thorarchaeota archaeon]